MTDDARRATNPWTFRDRRQIYDNPWIRVTEHDVLTPAGTPGIYGIVHFKSLATGVVPIDHAGHTWLVGQYRVPHDAWSWEMPEGGADPGEDALTAVQRELREETGLIAGGWQEVIRLDLSNAVTDEHAVGFVAWDLAQGPDAPEDAEALERRRLPFREAVAMVERGAITDAMSVATILRVELMRRQGTLPPPVARVLDPA